MVEGMKQINGLHQSEHPPIVIIGVPVNFNEVVCCANDWLHQRAANDKVLTRLVVKSINVR